MATSFDPFAELDRLAGAIGGAYSGPKFMPVDLFREGDQYVLKADLPGVDPTSVDVDVDGQLLSIRANRSAGSREHVAWLAKERPHGAYLRQFSVGEGIDVERITASYEDGVLSLTIPVSPKAKPRKIEIASGKEAQHTITAN